MTAHALATAYITSYANAMHLSASPSTTPSQCATALGAHYGPGMVSFGCGSTFTFPSTATASANILTHLERFSRAGLGWNIRMVEHEVQVVSDGPTGSALCWITWEIRPVEVGVGDRGAGSGVEGWRWRNLYGWRGGPGEGEVQKEGRWEFAVWDEEIKGLLRRVPDFLEL
ncbi:hypothetical protein LTR66_002991 [Elasticomyces elasticus]|nr:hypothetical protein LTR66_002991 [Elasticomyces elasticus]